MVDVSNKQNSTVIKVTSSSGNTNITASSSGNTANTNVASDYTKYYSEKSKEWAISDKIVDNADYSSKYYANESKKQANISTAKATEVVESGNTAMSNIETAKSNALNDINTTGAEYVNNAEQYAQNALNSSNNAKTSEDNAKTSEDNALSYKNSAMESSQTATEQANIATQKAEEATTSANNAKTSETNAKSSETRCEEILSRLGTAIKIKGRVNSLDDLPLNGNIDGDTYLIGEEGLDSYPEYYWYQDHWEFLGTSGTSLSWGLITGNISAQTDLQNALNGKLSTTGTADKALKDSNGLQISTNYMRRTIGDAWIPATSTAPTALAMVGRQGCGNGNIAGGNLVALHKNTLFRCYERGSTITCNYEDKVANLGKTMCDGSFSGHYTAINPSTSFTSKPFVWQVTSPTQYEVSDVCRLHLYGHRLSDAVNATKFKIEAYIQDTLTNSKKWVTVLNYSGASKNIAQAGFGLYVTGYSSTSYYSIFGVRLTISESPDTVFRLSEIQIVASRGTELLADSLQCVSNAGGKIWGNLEVTGTLKSSNTYTKTEVNNITDTKVDLDGSNYAGSGLEAIVKNNGGGGLEIGDIGIAPLGIDETKGKRRYLNGQLIIQEQYVQFTNKVKSAVALYPSLACTESEWQTTATMTVGGQVGKFVIDDEAGTIRLPKIIMPIQGLTDLSKLGEIVEAGLPNITGKFNGFASSVSSGASISSSGATIVNVNGTGDGFWNAQYLTKRLDTTFDASRSNSIYGNSNTVQQEQIQYPYFIQVATGAETEDNIINEIELNNPFVLLEGKYFETPVYNVSWLQSNTSFTGSSVLHPTAYNALLIEQNAEIEIGTTVNNYTKRGLSVKLTSEAYTDFDFVLDTENQTFRCPIRLATTNRYLVEAKQATSYDTTWYNLYSDGWCEQGGATSVGAEAPITITLLKAYTNNLYSVQITINGTASDANSNNYPYQALAKTTSTFKICNYASGAGANNYYQWEASGYVSETVSEDLTDKLYFYVGETVQNANLINAGRIEEKLVEKLDRSVVKAYITETYVDGDDVYRIWSDGWCEQTGFIYSNSSELRTITFLKTFKDISYRFFRANVSDVSNVATNWGNEGYSNKTTSSITIKLNSQYTAGANWMACGYLAEGEY